MTNGKQTNIHVCFKSSLNRQSVRMSKIKSTHEANRLLEVSLMSNASRIYEMKALNAG